MSIALQLRPISSTFALKTFSFSHGVPATIELDGYADDTPLPAPNNAIFPSVALAIDQAYIDFTGTSFKLRSFDEFSSNVCVNGQLLHQHHTLVDGDRLEFGLYRHGQCGFKVECTAQAHIIDDSGSSIAPTGISGAGVHELVNGIRHAAVLDSDHQLTSAIESTDLFATCPGPSHTAHCAAPYPLATSVLTPVPPHFSTSIASSTALPASTETSACPLLLDATDHAPMHSVSQLVSGIDQQLFSSVLPQHHGKDTGLLDPSRSRSPTTPISASLDPIPASSAATTSDGSTTLSASVTCAAGATPGACSSSSLPSQYVSSFPSATESQNHGMQGHALKSVATETDDSGPTLPPNHAELAHQETTEADTDAVTARIMPPGVSSVPSSGLTSGLGEPNDQVPGEAVTTSPTPERSQEQPSVAQLSASTTYGDLLSRLRARLPSTDQPASAGKDSDQIGSSSTTPSSDALSRTTTSASECPISSALGQRCGREARAHARRAKRDAGLASACIAVDRMRSAWLASAAPAFVRSPDASRPGVSESAQQACNDRHMRSADPSTATAGQDRLGSSFCLPFAPHTSAHLPRVNDFQIQPGLPGIRPTYLPQLPWTTPVNGVHHVNALFNVIACHAFDLLASWQFFSPLAFAFAYHNHARLDPHRLSPYLSALPPLHFR